jgi:hypothetical protein
MTLDFRSAQKFVHFLENHFQERPAKLTFTVKFGTRYNDCIKQFECLFKID